MRAPALQEATGELEPLLQLPLVLALLVFGAILSRFALSLLLGRPQAAREGSPAEPAEVVVAMPLFLLITLGVGVAIRSLFPPDEGDPSVLVLLCAGMVAMLPFIAAGLLRARKLGSVAPLGLVNWDLRTIGLGLACWALLMPLLLGIITLQPWLYELVGLEVQAQAWGEQLDNTTGIEAACAALLAVLVVPFFEELFFRGWLQQGLVARLGPTGGIVVTSAFFAILHAGVVVPIFLLALFLGFLRERTQSLWPSVLVHIAHNGVQVAALYAL